MPGLLDFLGELLGGGQQQGLLSQGMPQQGQMGNPMQDLSRGLLQAGQPSPYKKNFFQALGEAQLHSQDAQQQRQMGGQGAPSAIREFQYFDSLSPEQKQEYLKVKRAEQFLNAGDRFENPATGGVIPKGIPPQDQPSLKGDQAKAVKDAENLSLAQKNLPGVSDTANRVLKYVEEIRNHPGKSAVVGAPGVTGVLNFGKPIPGTDAASFNARLKQLKGGQFLSAYDTLKGGGQITEVEGAKAQDAIARMDTAQSEDEFDQALNDYEDVIKIGLERARKQAGVAVSTERPLTNPAAQPTTSNGVVSYSDYFK
jgi:hypothetical protein